MKTALLSLFLSLPSSAAAVACNTPNNDVMIGSCSGENTGFSSLKNACDKHPYSTLVKCRRHCVEREKSGLCKRCGWMETAKAVCTDSGDRMKLKQCSGKEAEFATIALSMAKAQIIVILVKLSSVNTRNMAASEKNKFAKAKHKAEKIKEWLDRDRKFVCKGHDGICKNAVAAAYPLTGGTVAIRLCPPFFTTSMRGGGATIIHEASHSCCGTTDKAYYSDAKQPSTSDEWHNIADTYWYWAVNNFCIPSAGGKCTPI